MNRLIAVVFVVGAVLGLTVDVWLGMACLFVIVLLNHAETDRVLREWDRWH